MATPDPEPKALSGADTPIMKQYQAAKARYPHALLFFRIGDFYELFFEDAKTISRVLGLTLTARNKGPDPVPMAGVPAHAAEQYLARLLRQGYSVAVCDQTEEASQAKGLVKREVTRVVTPGTALEDNLLEARKANRFVAIFPGDAAPHPTLSPGERGGTTAIRRFGVACIDLASGSFHIQELDGESALRAEMARLAPSECLLPDDPISAGGQKIALFPERFFDGVALSRLKPAAFSPREAHERIAARFSENGRDKQSSANLRRLSKDLPLALSAAGALTGYIDETFAGGKVLLSAPQVFDPAKFLALGESVLRSLELVETMRNRGFEGSLLWSIDRTCTGPGGRVLREWLIRPLRELEPLKARHDVVASLAENAELRSSVRGLLKNLADLERISARLSANKATPRDLLALKDSLALLPELSGMLSRGSAPFWDKFPSSSASSSPPDSVAVPHSPGNDPELLVAIREALLGLEHVAQLVGTHLKEDCSNTLSEGGLIKDGVDAELDRLHAVASGGKEWIAKFQVDEAARSGIASLKVGYNHVFGYYIEISRANQRLVPSDYERRQTLTNAERYTTPALKEREAEVLGAEEKINVLEQKLFLKLRATVADSAEPLHDAGRALAELDAFCSMAEVAHKCGHIRPRMSASGRLVFEQMRHPVLEQTLPKGELVPNDLALQALLRTGEPEPETETGALPNKSKILRGPGSKPMTATGGAPQILLLTGPNMAGKSTYIRSCALCVILAQMGAFVPAEKAEIGLVDRIFTRVGAADDLAGGRSTFMVEMTEVAEILAACSDRSLLILDEVGRGTSTYDGVSLAWALVEHLHQGPAQPRTLFATHYHELSALEDELPRVRNASASVKEWQGEITFMHAIVPGPSERSFGIHAARLAGLPAVVLERARAILRELEQEGSERVEHLTTNTGQPESPKTGPRRGKKAEVLSGQRQLQLFEPDPAIQALLEQLRGVDAQKMTPMEALAMLDKLGRKAKELY